MSRKDHARNMDLYKQMYAKLTSMQAFGESKRAAQEAGTDKDKIFSKKTYDTYRNQCKYFVHWMSKNHPEITTLKKARKYVSEYLQGKVDAGDSAWTVQTAAKALGKLYQISPEDKDYFTPPVRRRQDITRSRGDKVRDKHFSVTNNAELIKFCEGIGPRVSELKKLTGADLFTRDQIEAKIREMEKMPKDSMTPDDRKYLDALKDTSYFPDLKYFVFLQGKGGRVRFSPIFGPNTDQIVARFRATAPNEKVWQHVHSHADIHSYRGAYATRMYKAYAREIEAIPYDKVFKGSGIAYQSGVYYCRKDEKGKKLDRDAMEVCSKALGHNRVCIVAQHYIHAL